MNIPPWLIKYPNFNLDLHNCIKRLSDPNILKQNFYELRAQFHHYTEIYTDGSKANNRVSAAAVCLKETSSMRLPDSIFTAEIVAIKLALNIILKRNPGNFLILSDSLSSLLAIANQQLLNPHICTLLEDCHNLIASGRYITFTWIPSRIGIPGNELADKTAKRALDQPLSKNKIPFSDLFPEVVSHLTAKWQHNWSKQLFNKLLPIKPSLGKTKLLNISSRKDQVVLTRLRIGHTHLTHSWLLRREDQPSCAHCNTPLTVEHIMSCTRFQSIRNKFFTHSNLRDIFHLVPLSCLISFLKEISLFDKI